MNRVNIKILTLLSLLALLGGCKKYTPPELVEPKVPDGIHANLTIAEYKQIFAGTQNPVLIDIDYVIKAVVSGNDKTGNIYKQIYVQDETGGISIGCDQNSIATDYAEGQEVYIKLLGLAATSYGGQLQIGYIGTNANRLPYEIFKEKVLRNKWAVKGDPKPKVVEIASLTDAMVGTVIRLEGVSFDDGGTLPFAEHEATVNRTLTDSKGNTIIARNSGYATFSAETLPSGVGNVTGVLSKFKNDYQLFIRGREDVDFKGTGAPNSGKTPGSNGLQGIELVNEPFTASLGAFTAFSVEGDQKWEFKNYNNKGYANMSGYANGMSNANEDWLISPPLDLSDAKAAVLTFRHTWNKGNTARMKEDLKVMFSYNYANGNPNTATWQEAIIPTYPDGVSWKFVESGDVKVPDECMGKSNVHFAFRYTCDANSSGTWEINNAVLKK